MRKKLSLSVVDPLIVASNDPFKFKTNAALYTEYITWLSCAQSTLMRTFSSVPKPYKYAKIFW